MASQDGQLVAVLPVPDADGLVVGRGDDPGELFVELDCAHVVHMALQSEHTLFDFVVPDLDQVIITSAHEHWLRLVEVNAADGS